MVGKEVEVVLLLGWAVLKGKSQQCKYKVSLKRIVRDVDVLIDFENIGMSEVFDLDEIIRNVEWLGNGLEKALRHEGYKIRHVTVFARCDHPRRKISVFVQEQIYNAFEKYGWQMAWCNGIADKALIGWALDRLKKDELAPTVMLFSGDGDFLKMARKIIKSGRQFLVASHGTHHLLKSIAHKAFYL